MASFMMSSALFLSTPSARRATTPDVWTGRQLNISIHALREEGDYPNTSKGNSQAYFYPRPPRGGRRVRPGQRAPLRAISIHALREEGDRLSREKHPTERQFLSTPSARRATAVRDNL